MSKARKIMSESIDRRFEHRGIVVYHGTRDPTNRHLSTVYRIGRIDAANGAMLLARLNFQVGPVNQRGRNGLSEDILLMIVRDRLLAHQQTMNASKHNEAALTHIDQALQALENRRNA